MPGAALPNPTFRSAILRLPAHMRTDALNRFSANANAPGGIEAAAQHPQSGVRPRPADRCARAS